MYKMPSKQNIKTLSHVVQKIPRWGYFIIVVSVALLLYSYFFIWRYPIQFSYAATSCVSRITLLPNAHQSIDSQDFVMTLKGGWGGVFSTQVCASPSKVPSKGERYGATALFGGWLFRQQFAVIVPSAPVASVASIKKPFSVSKPLKIPLNKTDNIFDYTLHVASKPTPCVSHGGHIECDITPHRLVQGEVYDTKLVRSFGEHKTVVAQEKVTTLTVVTLARSSVEAGATLYPKQREFILETDKPLHNAQAKLIKIEGENRTEESIDTAIDAATIRLTAKNDLARDMPYELRIVRADARDGSGLDGDIVVPFRMSGGPKPSQVSASGQAVGLNDTAVITFDQNISKTQDIAKLTKVDGAPAEVSYSGNQLRVKLANAPKCTNVSITLAKGVLSEHDVPSAAEWKHSFRTTCRTVSTIGYSAQGRPIQAYYYGNGSETILFVGAIHGDEKSSSLILQDLMADLDVRAGLLKRQVVVVPTLNPDGYAAGSRNNARNVNLNRNFATNDWQTDLRDTNGEVKGGGGTALMSEPEARAIANLSSQLRPRFVLSYHAVGSVVIGNLAGDSSSRAAAYASAVGYGNGTGRDAEIFDYAISGTYDDWLAQKLGVPSMIVELGSYTYRNYAHHKAAMWNVITN